ncbi:PTS system mannose-specific transporter subunits IIA [Listeria fleischmannii 1991]|uniref:EIIAB-Man n=2 Tax=Listeria fleischmannii TaxID=1069827 RepID=A0A2X3H8J2_9LIST|nr:PTS sugar transporter subunit IIA [Listeria fleischmannii]EMG28779.1 PTS system mannose-specific transporter subunits IIA [Listeria fleischmannii subsp. fleischmannii LU2006-1]KMT60146.1 PTS system mannose-specific transporter subunits IIA [Listeria fleischmannii 1991]SQC68817.1 EIIAB-Man [Listeria fleischmannii subsp. fleischmannii]
MTAILVCTHGHAAKELIRSAEMICGVQKNTSFVSFEEGMTVESLQHKIVKEVQTLNLEKGILFLTDLKGGTPFNVLVVLLENYKQSELVAGVNIPLLLEAFIQRDSQKIDKLADQSAIAAVQGIYRYTMPTQQIEDDF